MKQNRLLTYLKCHMKKMFLTLLFQVLWHCLDSSALDFISILNKFSTREDVNTTCLNITPTQFSKLSMFNVETVYHE